MLRLIETLGNRLPHPVLLFLLLALMVVGASVLASLAGLSGVHPATGEELRAINLLSAETVRRMLVEMPRTFTGFPPLGTVLTVMIGIGIAERSGLIAAALGGFVRSVPQPLLALALVFAGIMSSLAADAGYVVLVPLGAALFAAAGRHPLAGLAAAFAGVSGGYSANLLVTSLDPLLGGISETAARMVDPAYTVQATANWFLMIALVPAFALAGAFVTVRIVEPRLGTWQAPEGLELMATGALSAAERRGLRQVGLASLLLVACFAALAAPDNAVLRNPETGGLEPFYNAIVALTAIGLALLGILYGRATGRIRTGADAVKMAEDAMASMASYILLAFMAAHFIAFFAWSNLGAISAISGAGALRESGLGGVPLLVGVTTLTALINLIMGSASAKWAILSTVFVPMFMLVGISPEATQAAYRIGDSVTNIITPLMSYFPLALVAATRYMPGMGIGTMIATMLPFSIAFYMVGIGMLLLFLVFGIPIGPGVMTLLPAQG
ncbi:MAG: AbgT family transporter [Sphingomonadaceae bacterium]